MNQVFLNSIKSITKAVIYSSIFLSPLVSSAESFIKVMNDVGSAELLAVSDKVFLVKQLLGTRLSLIERIQ